MSAVKRLGALLPALILTTVPALAHVDPAEHGSFAAGLTHPIFGLDHVLAMVTVGMWAALIGGRAIWAVPATFVLMMIVGFVVALAGIALPFVEPTILASVIVLGLLTAIALPLPVVLVMIVVAGFAVFHGHAHGSELGAATLAPYVAGFALATALLHLAGIAFSLAVLRLLGAREGRIANRVMGAAAALGGVALALV